MTEHDEDLVFAVGDTKTFPHSLGGEHQLTFTLVDVDDDTATFQLHNPEAKHDEMVGGLIWENLESVEHANRWRDKLHLPEKPVPVDTFTMKAAVIRGRLHEKLQIGDRVWTVSDVSAQSVTLSPGHDHEEHTLVNEVENAGYTPEATAVEEGLTEISESF